MYSKKKFLRRLKDLADDLQLNLSLAGVSTDPETIHRCRVDIRRIRGIASLYNIKDSHIEGIKETARLLSPLRDIEVEIGFISSSPIPMAERKLLLQDKFLVRDQLRRSLKESLPVFDPLKFYSHISDSINDHTLKPSHIFQRVHKASAGVVSALEQQRPIHTLRIRLKKLRYLLEALSPQGKTYSASIEKLKKLQDILGAVHDLEVWTSQAACNTAYNSYLNYLWRIHRKRIEEYMDSQAEIPALLGDIQDMISQTLAPERPLKGVYPLLHNTADKVSASAYLAAILSPDPDHIQRVMEKSTAIFMALKKPLKLKMEDLYILQCAALLHDIGHSIDSSSHHEHSYNLIRDSLYLPFNIYESERIAVIARNHRKKPDLSSGLLEKDDTAALSVLSGILRCADGMEIESYIYVEGLEASIEMDSVILRGQGADDLLIKRINKRSRLLEEAAGYKVKFIPQP